MLEQAKERLAERNTFEALALVDRQLAETPKNWSAMTFRGRVLERLGRFDEAQGAFDAALAIKPDIEIATTAADRMGRQADAFEQAKKALNAKQYSRALELLQALPAASASLRGMLIARAYLGLGRLVAAREAIEKFLAEQPGHKMGLNTQAKVEHAMKGETRRTERPRRTDMEVGPQGELADAVAAIEAAHPDGDIAAPVASIRAHRDTIAASLWQNSAVLAKAAHFAFATDVEVARRNFNAHLIGKSVDYGYLMWPKRIQDYIVGKTVLDVGCGFGAFGNGFLAAGARAYTGVDPQMPLDSPIVKNKRIRQRADLGMTPREIMGVCPDIRLVNGVFEDFEGSETFDVIVLHNVTEHLIQIDKVFEGMAGLMGDASKLIYHHHNFYCWNGHHQAPVQPAQYDPESEAHRRWADWNHILAAPSLPADHYFNTGLNQIKLDPIHALTEKYFEIEVWQEVESSAAVAERLTPAKMAELQAHDPTLDRRELMVNAVFCVAHRK